MARRPDQRAEVTEEAGPLRTHAHGHILSLSFLRETRAPTRSSREEVPNCKVQACDATSLRFGERLDFRPWSFFLNLELFSFPPPPLRRPVRWLQRRKVRE